MKKLSDYLYTLNSLQSVFLPITNKTISEVNNTDAGIIYHEIQIVPFATKEDYFAYVSAEDYL